MDKFIVYLVLIAFTAGCTTMQSVPATDAQSLASQIKVGDKIKIMRNDDTDVTFKVSAVSDEGVSGDGVFVAYSNIRQVQVRTVNPMSDTWGMVILIAVATAYILSQAGCANLPGHVCNE